MIAWTSPARAPIGPEGHTLPASFRSQVYLDGDSGLWMSVMCEFSGTAVTVRQVCVQAVDDEAITARTMTSLRLGHAVREATEAALDPPLDTRRRPGRKPDSHELARLATVYSLHHASAGEPRQAVMDIWGLPRSTANRWIRLAREAYPVMLGDGSAGHAWKPEPLSTEGLALALGLDLPV